MFLVLPNMLCEIIFIAEQNNEQQNYCMSVFVYVCVGSKYSTYSSYEKVTILYSHTAPFITAMLLLIPVHLFKITANRSYALPPSISTHSPAKIYIYSICRKI